MNAKNEQVLLERAKKLAMTGSEERIGFVKIMDVVLFRMGSQLYGIDNHAIMAISKSTKCIPIPCTPPHILGVTNIRGKIIAVVDFASLNGIKTPVNNDAPTMIVIGNNDIEFGFYVDTIESNDEIFESDLQHKTSNLEQIDKKGWIKAITVNGTIIFDIDKILSDEAIADIN